MGRNRIDWGEIARREGLRVFKAARAFAPDDDTAWDCVQEALLTAVKASPATMPTRPVEWLCGVAANKARHEFRGRSRFRAFLHRFAHRRPGLQTSPEVLSGDRAALAQALGRLTPKLRDAVILRFYAGMSMAEIARAQGGSESAGKMRVHRGLGRLRKILGAASLALLLAAEYSEASASSLAAAVATGGAVGGAGATGLVAATAATTKTALLVGAVILFAGASALFFLEGDDEARPAPPPVDPASVGLLADAASGEPGDRIDGPPAAPPETSIEGRGRALGVVLAPDGGVVPGALVSFARAGSPPRTCPDLGTSNARTDGEGRFSLAGLPPGIELVAIASCLPCRKTASDPFMVPEGGEVDGIIIRLLAGAAVFGRVVTDGGDPVAGADIRVTTGNTIRWVGANQPALLPGETTTSADGRYRLSGLERRTYRVFAEKKGYLPVHKAGARATFAGGEAPTLVLQKGLLFKGVMIDGSGEPVVNGVVSLAGKEKGGGGGQARTDAKGRFEIDTARPGPHRIYAGAIGYESWAPRDIEMPFDGPYRITLTAGACIEGMVRDTSGDPVARAVVAGWSSEGGTHYTTADAEGNFRIGGLPVSGSVTLTVLSTDPVYPDVTVACDTPDKVVLRPGAPVSISGRVVRPDGGPAPLARVEVVPAGSHRPRDRRSPAPHSSRSVAADREGRFEFDGLVGDRFEVRASRPGFLPSLPMRATGGERAVLLRLMEGLAISGSVEFEGEAPDWWWIAAEGADGRSHDGNKRESGAFTISGLTAGRYLLVITGENWRRRLDEVEAGSDGIVLKVIMPAELPFVDLRSQVPKGVHHVAWREFWAAVDELGLSDESGLIAAMPEILSRVSARPWSVSISFLLLGDLGTPDAIEMMVEMFRDPKMVPDNALREAVPHLLAIEHPGLGPAAIARLADVRERGEESWVTLVPLAKILARHGGEEGTRIFLDLLCEYPHSAVKGLGFARSPLILKAGLECIEGAQSTAGAAEAGKGLIEAFGGSAEAALFSRVVDADLPPLARHNAAAALASGCGLTFADRLLHFDPATDAEQTATIVTHLARRKDLPLEGARADILRDRARSLLAHPDASIRCTMLSEIRYSVVFRTPEMLRLLEERAEIEQNGTALGLIRAAMTNIRKTLEER